MGRIDRQDIPNGILAPVRKAAALAVLPNRIVLASGPGRTPMRETPDAFRAGLKLASAPGDGAQQVNCRKRLLAAK